MKKQIFLGFLILGIAIITPLNVYGAENSEPVSELIAEKVQVIEVNEDVELDENIIADDLDISEQNVLPNNPFYFFKRGWRGIQSAFIFNPVKKAELKLRFADERLIEAKKMAEAVDSKKASNIISKAIENYEKEVKRVKEQMDKFEGIDVERVEKFVERFSDHQIKQQKLINRIEKKLTEKEVSPEIIEKIIEHKERAMEHFANGALSAVNPEVLREKLEKVIEEGSGSEFKHFKNLEILKSLEERVPEEARKSIIKAQENAKKSLNNFLSDNKENSEKFKNFIENSGGDALRKLKVIDELDIDNFDGNIKRILNDAREKTLDKARDIFENIDTDDAKDKFFKRLENINIKDLNIINRLEEKLPADATERLRNAKEKVIENENRNKIKERLENKINNTKDQEAIKEKINNKGILNEVKKIDFEQSEKQNSKQSNGFSLERDKRIIEEKLQNTQDALIKKAGQVQDIINNAQ